MAIMLEPLQIRSLKLHNRLIMPPMATRKAMEDGQVSPELLKYYHEKSEGGAIGLIITEHHYINRQGKASERQLSVADDATIEGLQRLSKTIHANGSKAVVQINHAGSASTRDITDYPPVGPSAVMNPRKENELPQVLTKDGIVNVVVSFANAAMRVKKAGFDGVEIHSAHGYLLCQFFSALTNKRMDEYGGNVMNRIRIHLEVINAIRNAVGKDFPIFLRLGASDYMEGGSTMEDSVLAAREFEKAGLDAIDISGGFCGYSIPGTEGVQGYFSPLSKAIKKEVKIPVILTGGITDIGVAEQLLSDKKADLIGVGRAILADSTWARRAMDSLMG